MIDKDLLKNNLTTEEVFSIVDSFSGEPVMTKFGFIAKTICHNHPQDTNSRKLYYYNNSHLFQCYTECGYFDIFEFVIKCFEIQKNEDIELPQAIQYVLNKTGRSSFSFQGDNKSTEHDILLDLIDSEMTYEIEEDKKDMQEYPDFLIKNLPCLPIKEWEEEHITYDTLKKYNIRYYPVTAQIVIPHYDINNRLIGIRGRYLLDEDTQRFGKYMPLIASGNMYTHPLGFNLYGINLNKDNIRESKIAIVFESEKSVMIAESYLDKNISVAVCGSSLSNAQIKELLSLDVREIVIAFDRQYKEYKDEECMKWHDKINKIVCKYKDYVKMSVIFDEDHLLGYKDSPIDCGKETFLKLFKERKVVI